MTVAPLAEAVVRARIVGYAGAATGLAPVAMDVEVVEVLAGTASPGPLRVWGEDGWLCSPYVTELAAGTEWLLALNGRGSKPVAGGSPATSVCGQYWLAVQGDQAAGIIEGVAQGGPVERMALPELRRRLAGAGAAPPRRQLSFEGEVAAGHSFERELGDGLVFTLRPSPTGWLVEVHQPGRDEDLARLTPPFHFVPNPREIEGWHFRNADNTGPNEHGEKNVNAPGEVREFIFSPAVGASIDGPAATRSVTPEEVEEVRRFGAGRLTILDFRLGDLETGKTARFEWMRFRVEASWQAPSSRALGPKVPRH